MPRGARLDAPGTLHHVIIRGIEKGDIVRDDEDRKEFLRRMGELAQGTGTGIYAFALMTNHAHILLKSGEQGLSTFMRRLLSGYAQYFNRRHRRVGHLFQNRYKSIICEEEAYFDKLVAYIHLNPLRAGLVDSFEELVSYPWCGHAAMMNKAHCPWLDHEYVLQCFGDRESEARKAYVSYLEEEAGINREKELSGGGLLRSHEGWSNVLSMRKQGVKALSDDRILGGDSFVREVLQEAEDQGEFLLSADERAQRIASDIENVCRKEGITVAVLRSGSRKGRVSAIRKELAKKFVHEYGLSLAETARQLWDDHRLLLKSFSACSACCAPRLLRWVVLEILTYYQYAPVSARHPSCTQAAHDGRNLLVSSKNQFGSRGISSPKFGLLIFFVSPLRLK